MIDNISEPGAWEREISQRPKPFNINDHPDGVRLQREVERLRQENSLLSDALANYEQENRDLRRLREGADAG